jgi:hypothetical protein
LSFFLIKLHFTQTTLDFSIITKIPFLLTLLNFQKFHITHMSFTQTDIYFTLTNYVPSLQTHELSQLGCSVWSALRSCRLYSDGLRTWTVTAFPPKKNLVPRFGRKILKGREANYSLEVTGSNHTKKIVVNDKSCWSMTRWV